MDELGSDMHYLSMFCENLFYAFSLLWAESVFALLKGLNKTTNYLA